MRCVICRNDITGLDLDKFEKNPDFKQYKDMKGVPQICSRMKCREKFERRERKQGEIRLKEALAESPPIEKKLNLQSISRQPRLVKGHSQRVNEKNTIMKNIYAAVEKDDKGSFISGLERLKKHIMDSDYDPNDLDELLSNGLVGRVSKKMLEKQKAVFAAKGDVDQDPCRTQTLIEQALLCVAEKISKEKNGYSENVVQRDLPGDFFHQGWLKSEEVS